MLAQPEYTTHEGIGGFLLLLDACLIAGIPGTCQTGSRRCAGRNPQLLSIIFHVFDGRTAKPAWQSQRVYAANQTQGGRTRHKWCVGCRTKQCAIWCEGRGCGGVQREDGTEWRAARII